MWPPPWRHELRELLELKRALLSVAAMLLVRHAGAVKNKDEKEVLLDSLREEELILVDLA